MTDHRVGTREEWLAARKQLLREEKEGVTTEQIERQPPFGDRVLLVIDGAALQVVPLPGTGTR